MKKTILGLGALAFSSSLFAAPAFVLVDQGGTNSGLTSDDSATAFADLAIVPSPSNTDLIAANAGFQIDSRLTHGGTVFNLAKMTDGDTTVTYPDQLPNDNPGVATPAISLGWAFSGATTVGSVVCYAYNWNGGTPDVRSLPVYGVQTTTDSTVNAGSTWTPLLGYTDLSGASPAGVQFFTGATPPGDWTPYGPAGHAGAVVAANDAGGALATGITGIRVDIYCSGFGDAFRNANNTGVDVQAVSSPFLAEIDVLNVSDTQAFFTPGAAAKDWELYN